MAQEIYHRSEWGNPTEQWGNVYLNADLTNELYKRASEYENSWVTDQLLNGVGIKPSIILTPTAYEDGILNSVKPQRTFGSELVTNGNFDTDTNWTKGAGWTISGGTANYADSSISPLYQNITLNISSYELKFTISNSSGNGASIWIGNSSGSVSYTDGTYQYYTDGDYTLTINVPSSQTTLTFYGHTQGSSFSIDNVSVKEIIDADFDFTRGSSATRVNELGLVQDVQLLSGELVQNGDFEQIGSELVNSSNWINSTSGTATITNGVITFVNGTGYLYQGIISANTFYKFSIELSNVNQGQLLITTEGGVNSETLSTNGIHEFYLKSTSAGALFVFAQSNFTGTIDNVSVKEVGQNWLFQNGWNMGDGVAVYSGTVSAYRTIYQQNVLTVSSKYRLTFDIVSIASGSIENISQSSPTSYNTVGTKTEDFIATSTDLFLKPTTDADLTIDNISVVEVTDDTDLPRINYTNFDYENGEVVPYSGEGSLLLEPQSTNLITYSELFSDSYWAKSGSSVVSGFISPDGTSNAFKLVENTATTTHQVFRAFSYLNAKYSLSVFLKADERNWIKINLYDGTSSVYAYFDLTNGVVGQELGVSGKIENYGNGWYRCSMSTTSVVSLGSGNISFRLAEFDGGTGYTGNGTSGLYIFGAQLEQLSYATSYIPTNGSTVTRLADVCNNSGSSDLINSTEGVLYAEVSAFDNTIALNRKIVLGDGSFNNGVEFSFQTTTNKMQFIIRSGGTVSMNIETTAFDVTEFNKIAIHYKPNEGKVFVNGNQISVTDTSVVSPVGLNRLDLKFSTAFEFEGNVKCVAVFKEALSDTELEKLTTI